METAADPGTRGRAREDIARRTVQLIKEYGGKGPTKARTYIEDDLVIVLLRGGFTQAEQTLFEDGKWQDVRTLRHAFQDTMEARLSEVIEQATGRAVIAFMSASHQDPDLQIEVYLLDAEEAPDVEWTGRSEPASQGRPQGPSVFPDPASG